MDFKSLPLCEQGSEDGWGTQGAVAGPGGHKPGQQTVLHSLSLKTT